MTQKPASIIIDAIGPDRLEVMGFTPRLIRHVRATGRFAASWYRSIAAECAALDIECPLEAFNWKNGAE